MAIRSGLRVQNAQDTVRFMDWQWPEKCRIDEAENRGVPAYSQG
jgi:hypothetical protein